jgi:U3 small nucleolar RNA-associated protein 18
MPRKTRAMAAGSSAAAEEPADTDDLFVLDTKGSTGGGPDSGKQKKKKSKKERKATKAAGGEAREAEWERLLFGASGGAEADDAPDDEQAAAGRDDGSGAGSDDDGAPAAARASGRAVLQEKRAVWHDDDDDTLTIDLSDKQRLRKLRKSEDETAVSGPEFVERVKEQATKLSQSVNWATRKKMRKHDGEGDSLLRSGAALSGHRSATLPSAVLEVERLKDANAQDVSDAVVQVARFHPNSQLLMTASLDKRLKFFQIDGKTNAKVQGVCFDDLPIQHAEFSPDGAEVIVSGRRKHFYVYNLAGATVTKVQGVLGNNDKFLGALIPSPDSKHIAALGTCGHIGLLSSKTKQWIGQVKMNCDVSAAVFAPDGHSLYTAGKSDLVYHWDLRMRRCVKKIKDDGSLHITSLAISHSNIMAVGSRSGVCNTYSDRIGSDLPALP